MIVVHAVWLAGARLALWGEDSRVDDGKDRPTRGRRGERIRWHPFCASAEALAEALAGALAAPPAAHSSTGAAATRVLILPTRSGRPLDSPELIRDELPGPSRASTTVAPWRVSTLEFGPDDLMGALAAMDTDPIAVGSTVRQAMQLAAFCRDLVVRGRVLPTLSGESDRGAALWRPVLIGADAVWTEALALALPPASRCAQENLEPAGVVVAEVIDALVDAAGRSTLARRASPEDGPPWRSWCVALTGRERAFRAPPAQLAALTEAIDVWQREAGGGRVRACFRLVEPAEGDLLAPLAAGNGDSWRLEFALQSAQQPSLVVDAERIWKSRGLKALTRLLDSPQETLLGELGRACRLYSPLETALRTKRPASLDLDGEAAHDFLRESAPMLAGAGFGVMLPSWWSRPRARLGARLRVGSPTAPGTVTKASQFGLKSIVDYQWELALGDEPLTEAELEALTELKTPLVRLRGQWVELDAKRLAAGLKFIGGRSLAAAPMTLADLLHTGLSTDDGPGGLPVVSIIADGPLGELLSGQAERRITPMVEPDGFTGTLRPYQQRGLAWLAFLESLGLGPILADSMGLGKTIQLLALIQHDLAQPPQPGPTLLVCPMSLVGNWQREAARFTPQLRVHVHHGAERARGKQFTRAVTNADLVLTTYALAARDGEALAETEWHRLVLDEAQAIKNAATRQATAVRSLPARHRIAVTGTPVENRLADLWSIMEFANPGLLGTSMTFKSRYAEPIERRGDELAADRLRRLTGPFILRREKTDKSIISDLPDKIEMEVVCNLTAEQASLYQAVVDDMMAKIDGSEGIERRGLVLATMTKLKQVCNHPAHLLRDGSRLAGRSGKLARLEEILDEVLDSGEKALLFTQYAEFGGMLRSHLAARFGREVAFLHGGVGKNERDTLVTRFQSDHGPPLFVLSLKAGGTGLTLTAANHVVHVDRWWNPAVEDQATDRAFRIGQRRNVQVRKFVCAGTLEEKISAMIRDKRGLAASIIGTGEGWLTELSTAELRELFRLESGSVVE